MAGALTLFRNCAMHTGESAFATALSARPSASLSAVPPVTQPPQLNPTTASAIAPATAPQMNGDVSAGILGKFMRSPRGEALVSAGCCRRSVRWRTDLAQDALADRDVAAVTGARRALEPLAIEDGDETAPV